MKTWYYFDYSATRHSRYRINFFSNYTTELKQFKVCQTHLACHSSNNLPVLLHFSVWRMLILLPFSA